LNGIRRSMRDPADARGQGGRDDHAGHTATRGWIIGVACPCGWSWGLWQPWRSSRRRVYSNLGILHLNPGYRLVRACLRTPSVFPGRGPRPYVCWSEASSALSGRR
jgi:hypothetical protein